MKLLNIQEAKTHLSRLVDEAVAGEDIVIAKAGRPQVRLVPCLVEDSPRVLGVPSWQGKGKVWIADDFDAVDQAIVAMFEGKDQRQLATVAKATAKSGVKPRPKRRR